jgi:hypothetical protein
MSRRHRSGHWSDQQESADAAMPTIADKLGTGCWNGRSVIARSRHNGPEHKGVEFPGKGMNKEFAQ